MLSSNTKPMSRWKAGGIHLSISLIIAALVGSLIYFVWYPPPYFEVAGGSSLVLLIMCVDVVLGPCLTLAVFRFGKKGLAFDLAVIAALQVGAFCYGISIIALARPVFIVARVDRFVPVYANDLEDQDLAAATSPEFSTRSWTGPRLVGVALPTDAAEKNALTVSGVGGKDIDKFPKYYVPYDAAADALMQRAKPLKNLIEKHPAQTQAITAFANSTGQPMESLAYLPLAGRTDSYSMIMSSKSRRPLGAIAVDPW